MAKDNNKRMLLQQTIKSPIECSGIGLHTGKKVHMVFRPADEDTGIVFKRVDIAENCIIKAVHSNLASVNYATAIQKDGYEVQTIEHLLAALAGMAIDNLIIELDSFEVPIMDGSAAPFIFLLHEAGIRIQKKVRQYIRIKKSITIGGADKYIKVVPSDTFKITYSVDYNHPVIGAQSATYRCIGEPFIKKICRARTFGFLNEIKVLRQMGLTKGGSLDNAIVIDNYRIINGALRFKDEFVCHKIMDAMGDLYLLGKPILGHIIAHRAGHGLHTMLVEKILKSRKKWDYYTYGTGFKEDINPLESSLTVNHQHMSYQM
ncbi:MAG: UDP-3-O-acyl-N-acetylglucosamine deacetylase [bacterium]